MQCVRHPNVETHLRCATCGTPICPDCLVSTPVGMKCPDCGLAPVPAVFRLTPGALARAMAMGAVGGMAAGFLTLWLPRGASLLLLLGTPLIGRLVADAARWAAGGRRGTILGAAVAGACAIGVLLLAPDLGRLFAGAPLLDVRDVVALVALRPLLVLYAGCVALFAYWRFR